MAVGGSKVRSLAVAVAILLMGAVVPSALPPEAGATGFYEYYFAEGTVRPGFVSYLTLQNPATSGLTVTIEYQASNDSGQPVPVPGNTILLPPESRTTINVNDWVEMNGVPTPLNISTKISAAHAFFAERPVYFAADPALGSKVSGGTSSTGASWPETQLFFAEGTVRPGFVEYLTLQNPNPLTATTGIAFQAADDLGMQVPVTPLTIDIPPESRSTLNVSQYVTGLGIIEPLNVSVSLISNQPIVGERPMYFHADPALGKTVGGGTTVTGVPCPCEDWMFAEGTVRPGFVEYLTLQNPNGASATVNLSFRAMNDLNVPVPVPPATLNLAPGTRATFNVRDWVKIVNGINEPLNISTFVESDQPLVAERPMYFDADPALGTKVDGGSNVVGSVFPWFEAFFAEGTVRPGFVEYLTIMEAASITDTVTVYFQAADDAGNPVGIFNLVLPLPADSRVTVNISEYLKQQGITHPLNVSTKLFSPGTTFVAERPMYFDANPALGAKASGGDTVVGVTGI